MKSILITSALVAAAVNGQAPQLQQLKPQTNTFASNFQLTKQQISSLNLSEIVASNLEIAVRFEQSNWATGSVLHDPFYTELPSNTSSAEPGSILKVEHFTETANYTLPPAVALSRFIYQSKTLNGSLVPVSAYILWPYLNRNAAKAAPVVSWAHGTSGVYAECAPSHMRNLFYQYGAPYELALAGYAVVASDFAGLGVAKDLNGNDIVHQYVASPSTGYDVLYAAQAAQEAFPGELTKEFVVFGHSQGGAASWAAAQNQVDAQVPGYLGAIAAAPITNAIEQSQIYNIDTPLLEIAQAVHSIYPHVPLSDILTPEGLAFDGILSNISSCNSGFSQLFQDLIASNPKVSLLKDDFLNSTAANQFANLTAVGGKDFEGPMLILQGTNDQAVIPALTSKSVNRTCEDFGHRGLHYVEVKGSNHFPVLYATQQLWLTWIDERFASASNTSSGSSKALPSVCSFETIGINSPQPLDHYT